jgi:hypothetical protein
MVATPEQINFLYRFETPSGSINYTDIAENQDYNGEIYNPIQIKHSAPKFSEEPQDAEIDVTIHENNALATRFVLGPPPYKIRCLIYELDRLTELATPVYRGWVIRPSFDLQNSIVSFRMKTVWHFFERESFSDSISALSRYSIFDPRSGVSIENYRVGITILSLNDERDVLTVSGITEIDDWFKGGMIIAPDQDKRTIIKHETVGADKVLTLNAAFPRFTLDTGFPADIYPGDDLTYDTWANKFGADTNNGEAHGGWQHTPNVDPALRGVI